MTKPHVAKDKKMCIRLKRFLFRVVYNMTRIFLKCMYLLGMYGYHTPHPYAHPHAYPYAYPYAHPHTHLYCQKP